MAKRFDEILMRKLGMASMCCGKRRVLWWLLYDSCFGYGYCWWSGERDLVSDNASRWFWNGDSVEHDESERVSRGRVTLLAEGRVQT